MKVRIAFTVDIDHTAWYDEYGTDRDKVREDVQEHARQTVLQQFDSLGVLA